MTRNESLIREVDEIRRSPSFSRSPMLSNILGYLLACEVAGRSAPTQYDIAIEAMGRGEGFDEQSDSGVRVQISRLRKALENYYLIHQPTEQLFLYIRIGEYRLRTAKMEIAYPDLASLRGVTRTNQDAEMLRPLNAEHDASGELIFAHRNHTMGKPEFRFSMVGVAAAAVFAAFVLLPWQSSDPAEALAAKPYPLSVPTVYTDLQVTALANQETRDTSLIESVGLDVQSVLQKSMISRLADARSGDIPQYTLAIDIRHRPDGKYNAFLALTDRAEKVIAERTVLPTESQLEIINTIHDEVTALVSPTGHIARDISDDLGVEPKNSFECFLIVENSRSNGATNRSTLKNCIATFPDQEYTPYLEIREIFMATQIKMLAGEKITPSDPEWRRVSALLQTNPDNPYANMMAAKLLVGLDQCGQSSAFKRDALSRGQTYPTLELAILVDAFGCTDATGDRSIWSDKIKRISLANPDPSPLLESYIILGSIISDQEWLLKEQKSPLFAQNLKAELSDFNSALRKAISGSASERDLEKIEETLPALIFSRNGRAKILSSLRNRNAVKRNYGP